MIDPNSPDHEHDDHEDHAHNAQPHEHAVDYYDEAYDEDLNDDDPLAEKPPHKGMLDQIKAQLDSNPAAKLAAVVVGIGVLAGGAFMLVGGNKKPAQDQAAVTNSPDQATYTPGNETSEQYQQLIKQQNEDTAKQAEQSHTSAIPTPSGPVRQDANTKEQVLDPLEQFVQQNQQQPAPPTQAAAPMTAYSNQPAAATPAQANGEAAPPAGPDPAVAEMGKAMSEQMQSLIQAWGPSQAQTITYTPAASTLSADMNGGSNLNGGAASLNAGGGTLGTAGVGNNTANNSGNNGLNLAAATQEPMVRLLIPAGDVVYGQMFTEANSDVPSPILASLVAGPLKGARMIGEFKVFNDYLYISFTKLSMRGKLYQINAIALDPNTTLAGVATEVDQRYFSRIIVPAAADFVKEFGNVIANRGVSTTTIVNADGTVVQTQNNSNDIDFNQAANAGLGEAANTVSSFAKQEAGKIQPLVRVEAGTPVGIFFLDPLTEPVKSDNSSNTNTSDPSNSNVFKIAK